MKKPSPPVGGLLCLYLFIPGIASLAMGACPNAGQARKTRSLPYVTGHFRSPDKKYSVTVEHDAGDIDNITVVEVKISKKLVKAKDVSSFRWVPGSPHRLVVGASGLYGHAMLAMWEGGNTWQNLARVREPSSESFTIYGVSRDGRFLTYGHSRNVANDPGGVDETEHRHRLRLPPRRSKGR